MPIAASSSPPDEQDAGAARRARFEQVFDEHFRAVSAYAFRRATPGDAGDAVAETFLIAWRRLDEMPVDARPWLLGVARRVLANQPRAAGRRTALREGLANEPQRGQEPLGAAPVLRALGRLSEGDRELQLLVAWDGLSTREAAAALGCSRAAAKVRLYRARSRLWAQLERLQHTDSRKARRLEECHDE